MTMYRNSISSSFLDFVESDISSDDRFLYLHGEGDIPTSHMSTAAATNDLLVRSFALSIFLILYKRNSSDSKYI